jgi:hypothetical protein
LISQENGRKRLVRRRKRDGKSETARQFAAKTGRAFVRINFEKYTSKEDYLGATGLVDGETVFQPQAFLSAFETPSTVILLDELTNADPANLAPLNGFFGAPKRGLLRWRSSHPCGWGSGVCRRQHFVQRRRLRSLRWYALDELSACRPFQSSDQFSVLPIEKEAAALMNHTNCTEELAMHVMYAITVARGKVQTADIVDAPSIRSAIAFIRALDVLPIEEAWQTAVVNRQPSESHAALQSIFASCINPRSLTAT